jgi:hypothetical protein
MKKILTLGLACLTSIFAYGQVTVTYQLDATDFIAAGATLANNGMRIGGDFAANGGVSANDTMVDWSPTDTASGMAALGNDLFSISVTYPASSIGATQYYKYVNGNWGDNEGTATTTTIATDGCGVDDGAGNINRTLVIPSSDTTLRYCWDACYQCDGSDPGVVGLDESAFISLSIYPNPANGPVSIDFSSRKDGKAAVRIVNLLGQTVNSFSKEIIAGENHIVWSLDAANGSLVNNGAFLVEITVNGERTMQRIAVSH